jgi:hypothetical protein
MARVRGKNIDEETVAIIVGILDGWSGKLSWNLLIDAVFARVGHRYVRQALDANERISHAYKLHRGRLRERPPELPNPDISPEEQVLQESIERLEAENERLSAENNLYRETFTIWLTNASYKGLTEDYLNTPLTKVNREQTKEKKVRRVKG